MEKNNVKISSILEYQVPEFIRVEYPLLIEFLREYYRSTEITFGANDIVSNIQNYIKIENLNNIVDTFYLFNESKEISEIVKNSTTILNNESLIRIKTSTPHNFIDGDTVDIQPESSIIDSIEIDRSLSFNGVRFTISVINENEFYCIGSGEGISNKNFVGGSFGVVTKSNIDSDSDEIIIYSTVDSKKSLPISYGLIQIDEEVILFKDIEDLTPITVDGQEYTSYKLLNCTRGFSGVTSIDSDDQLTFSSTVAEEHFNRAEVKNLSSIFLKEFLKKIKYLYLPGFEDKELNPELNQEIFIKQSKDFYSSKGTNTSFDILFNALYGENVKVIKPRDYLIEPSDADFRVVKDLVVEALEGNPEELNNKTLFQDDFGFINPARGTVSLVERIERDDRTYYIVSIDDGYERDINFRGTLFSEFSIHPKTQTIQFLERGSTHIDVDSTIGFPNSGELVVKTIDPVTKTVLTYEIEYQTKSSTQFLKCKTKGSIVDNINFPIYTNSEVFSNAFAYGFSNDESLIRVRITGVLSEFEQQEKTYLYESGNRIRVKSLGLDSRNRRDNDWVFNIPVSYAIKFAFLKDSFNNLYEVEFFDNHNFHLRDSFYFEEDSELFATVVDVTTENRLILQLNISLGVPAAGNRIPRLENKTITKILTKCSIQQYPELNFYNVSVTNTYVDTKDNSTYVTSGSLPAYSNNIDVRDGSLVGKFNFGIISPDGIIKQNKLFTDGEIDYSYITVFLDSGVGDQAVKHGFYTGDSVILRSLNPNVSPLPDGIYYVRDFRTEGDEYGIKLSSSRSNILNEKYTTLTKPDDILAEFDTVGEYSLQYFDFSIVDFNSENNFLPQLLESQNLIRKISDPVLDSQRVKTKEGSNGIFLNGVEVLNYKSTDNVFYGPIEKVISTAPGRGYDVIHPPEISVTDIGGAKLSYSSSNGTAVLYNGSPLKFGVSSNSNPVTYDGVGGEPIIINDKTLILGNKQLFIGQTGGTIVRINNLILSVGGEGGTQLDIGGTNGFEARIGNENITLGNIGSGCVVYPNVIGKLERIDLIYQGFNYVGTPKIFISGGNGNGAIAEPVMESFEYIAQFAANSLNLNFASDTIGFTTYHNFENFEEVVYINPENQLIQGLQSRSRYVVNVIDSFRVKLFKSKEDAVSGINTISITSTALGIHGLKSVKNKSKIGKINVINSGSGYQSKKVSTLDLNVNIVTNVITVTGHGYNSGEKIIYYTNDTPIGGINQNTPYYVTKIDDNNFKLSEVNTGSDKPNDFFYTIGEYVDLTSAGSGRHFFDYEPISVRIDGFIGVSTSGVQNLNAVVQPIFRGSIENIFVETSGDNYGTSDILNYSRQPEITVSKGKNASLLPILNDNGSIKEVLILNPGKDYISTPDIIVRGDGNGAVLTPILKNNSIVEVKVIYGGSGYTSKNTIIDIVDTGEGLRVFSSIKSWNVNLLKRYRDTGRESADGGIFYSGLSDNYGLQYTHVYLADELRKIIYKSDANKQTITDFEIDRSVIKEHSPIVGWAYDGNPIYGPYGYSNGVSGTVRAMRSNYVLKTGIERSNGPSFTKYQNGFFVEDYEYNSTNGGDLDESNGRFCRTPEYPNGVYAYFCTVDTNIPLIDGKGFEPQFPYVIGNVFKSKPIEFNFDKKSNQNEIDINKTNWYRNTHPYCLKDRVSCDYKYLLSPNRIKDPISEVKYSTFGQIEFVDVVVSGDNYQVGDKIKFQNGDVIGQDATAEVSFILGKEVRDISIERSSFDGVEFIKNDNGTELIGFTEEPHGYSTGDIVSITTPIEKIVFKDIYFFNNNLFVTKNIPVSSTTGIVTYFEVSGDLSYPTIRENDIYTLPSNEQVKILNIDENNKTIRVLREYNNVVSSGIITSGYRLVEDSRKFNCNLGIQTYYDFKSNYDYYFNAKESVGLGTQFGPGITSTVYPAYSTSGVISPRVIPTQTIYLPKHGFVTNETLDYSPETSSFIRATVNGGVTTFDLPDRVNVVKITDDLIGISTVKVGIGTDGDVGIYRNLENPLDTTNPLLSFTFADGADHRFKTLRDNILTAKVSQNIVTVSTSSTHGLTSNDLIDIKVEPESEKNIVIEYNDESRLLVVNPKPFLDDDVDVDANTFNIINHGYKTGDKVIYKSETPLTGLSDNQIYYVVAINRNEFALASSFYESNKEFPRFINISNPTDGTFYSINPPITAVVGQTIFFDLSSETLSFTQGSSTLRIPSFEFDLFFDSNFNHKFISSGKSSIFDVKKVGKIGVDADAYVSIKITDKTPKNLYYKLTPLDINGNPQDKLLSFIDTEQNSNNILSIVPSIYDGQYKIFDPIDRDVTQPPFLYSEFKYQIPREPESESYNLNNSNISYKTTSTDAFGPIDKVSIKNKGRYFYRLPSKTLISTNIGTGAIVSANSTSIGEIKTVNIKDIGFDYPSDLSIRPIANLPTIYKVEPLYSFERITIISNGVNYLQAPNIVVIDNKTSSVIDDVFLQYQLGDNFVSIIRNTKNLSNIVPRLVPVNNTNGIPLLLNISNPIVLDISNNADLNEVIAATDNAELTEESEESSFNLPDSLPFTNLVTIQLFLGTEYSSIFDFPFELGDLVFIEDVVTIEETNGGTSKGFNSENYNYSLFRVVRRDPNIGGSSASITLDFAGYIPTEQLIEAPGSDAFTVDKIISQSARVVPVKYFPQYQVVLQKNDFIIDEELVTLNGESVGTVEQWDNANDYIKIAERIIFGEGDQIIGQTSKTKANLLKKIEFDAGYTTGSTSVVNKGWQSDTGKLNSDLQRTNDSDFYQYFSYALRSKIPIDKWDDVVGSLNHTAGFKRFSQLQVESEPGLYSGISTSQDAGVSFGIGDIISEVSLNCYYDFDLVRETTFANNPLRSNELIFGSAILQDYIESVGNRVLNIDDISKNFNALPRETSFSVVARSDSTEIRTRKFFFYTQDRRFINDKQMNILLSTHDNFTPYLSNYGRLETRYDLAYFDSRILSGQQQLLFYPNFDETNNYLIDFIVLEMTDDPEDIENINFGDVARTYNQVGVLTSGSPAGVGNTVVGIASTYFATKLIVQTGAASTTYYQVNEITILKDDYGKAKFIEYGEITTSGSQNESVVGVVSYSANILNDGSIDLIAIPYEDLTDDYNVKTITVSIGGTEQTDVGSLGYETGSVRSFKASGIGTEIPAAIQITAYDSQYKCAYMIPYVTGIQTGSKIPFSFGNRSHGISDWYAFDDATITYSTIYPETQIIGINTLGYNQAIVTTGLDPQRGTVGFSSGLRYYATKPVNFFSETDNWKTAPVSYAGTTFGTYVTDRGDPSGISTYYVYAPFEDAVINQYDNDVNGILGIASDTLTLPKYTAGILTSAVADGWVYFESTKPVIITTQGPGSFDSSVLAPSVTGVGTTNYKYYAYSSAIPSTEYRATAYGTLEPDIRLGITTAGAFSNEPIIALQRSDGDGSDDVQGILSDYLADTYSWGNTLSDYQLVAPFGDTTITVSYWDGTQWQIGETHVLIGGDLESPQQVSRDGDNGFGVWGTNVGGSAANLAAGLGDSGSDPNLWKFEGNNPFALFINDTTNREETMLGFSSSTTSRPLNKEYRVSEIQVINDQVNSYITEFGTLVIPAPSNAFGEAGIGTFRTRQVGSNTILEFVPTPLTEVEIRGYLISIGRF
jgi:hypothetical protein